MTYLRHRNIQVKFQQAKSEEIRKRYKVPDDWFSYNELKLSKHGGGWSFYFYLLFIVTVFGLVGVWIS